MEQLQTSFSHVTGVPQSFRKFARLFASWLCFLFLIVCSVGSVSAQSPRSLIFNLPINISALQTHLPPDFSPSTPIPAALVLQSALANFSAAFDFSRYPFSSALNIPSEFLIGSIATPPYYAGYAAYDFFAYAIYIASPQSCSTSSLSDPYILSSPSLPFSLSIPLNESVFFSSFSSCFCETKFRLALSSGSRGLVLFDTAVRMEAGLSFYNGRSGEDMTGYDTSIAAGLANFVYDSFDEDLIQNPNGLLIIHFQSSANPWRELFASNAFLVLEVLLAASYLLVVLYAAYQLRLAIKLHGPEVSLAQITLWLAIFGNVLRAANFFPIGLSGSLLVERWSAKRVAGTATYLLFDLPFYLLALSYLLTLFFWLEIARPSHSHALKFIESVRLRATLAVVLILLLAEVLVADSYRAQNVLPQWLDAWQYYVYAVQFAVLGAAFLWNGGKIINKLREGLTMQLESNEVMHKRSGRRQHMSAPNSRCRKEFQSAAIVPVAADVRTTIPNAAMLRVQSKLTANESSNMSRTHTRTNTAITAGTHQPQKLVYHSSDIDSRQDQHQHSLQQEEPRNPLAKPVPLVYLAASQSPPTNAADSLSASTSVQPPTHRRASSAPIPFAIHLSSPAPAAETAENSSLRATPGANTQSQLIVAAVTCTPSGLSPAAQKTAMDVGRCSSLRCGLMSIMVCPSFFAFLRRSQSSRLLFTAFRIVSSSLLIFLILPVVFLLPIARPWDWTVVLIIVYIVEAMLSIIIISIFSQHKVRAQGLKVSRVTDELQQDHEHEGRENEKVDSGMHSKNKSAAARREVYPVNIESFTGTSVALERIDHDKLKMDKYEAVLSEEEQKSMNSAVQSSVPGVPLATTK